MMLNAEKNLNEGLFALDAELAKYDHKWLNPWLDYEHGDRKSTRLNSSHMSESRMPSSA